ncbi:putative methyltransferase C9orf114 homolog [Prorops nasuta]|uniref:putative methyltransferase C9orf114 homolog n=1 Tax=Prorops nasuta TaxID=863751 RepID=UPI0034CDDF33
MAELAKLNPKHKLHKQELKKWREEKLLKKLKKEETKKDENVAEKPKFEKKAISTVDIAVPGSILDNAQSPELRTYLAGQIARAACIYQIDSIIVFDDQGEITESEKKKIKKNETFGEGRAGCIQLARILQYLECPQYLRKNFFPIHKDLQYAGILNPLDTPHHLRQQDKSVYREGIVTNKPIKAGHGSQVNVGLKNDVHIDKLLVSGIRVTVKLPLELDNTKKVKGIVVPPTLPRSEAGIYWGYSVRLAHSLSDIIANCPYKEGYDLTIGTSDKGSSIDDIPAKSLEYHHLLIVFGGLAGLEAAVEEDSTLSIDDPSLLFHKYLNTCPMQGSRTIRTEEALLVSLAELRTKLKPKNPSPPTPQFYNINKEMPNDTNR